MFLATCINADCGRSGPMVTNQVVISYDHATLPRLKIEKKKSHMAGLCKNTLRDTDTENRISEPMSCSTE